MKVSLLWLYFSAPDNIIQLLPEYVIPAMHLIRQTLCMGTFVGRPASRLLCRAGWKNRKPLPFLSSSVNDFSQCLDILAHEFTHCVTGSIMTYNAYLNDYGAINEAMSDIHGNICEMMAGATEDTTWALGENSTVTAFRSMSDPHLYQQPEYTWDYYYRANVKAPTTLNDHGGVHTNSSLLNNIAYRLCAEGGMTLEEARSFRFAVDCSMVPGTDYAQLSELMPWVLGNLGMVRYAPELEAALDATHLRSNDLPETFDADRALVTLTLPDEEIFQDSHWGLSIFSVDAEGLAQRVSSILEDKDGYEGTLSKIFETLFAVEEAQSEAKGQPTPSDSKSGIIKRLIQICQTYFGDLIRFETGVAGQDGRTVRLVSGPGLTVPVLFRLEFNSDEHIESTALAVYALGSWHDVATAVASLMENADSESADPSDLPALLLGYLESSESGNTLLKMLPLLGSPLGKLISPQQIIGQLLFTIERGAVNEIPATGLTDVATLNKENFPLLEMLNKRTGLWDTETEDAASDVSGQE